VDCSATVLRIYFRNPCPGMPAPRMSSSSGGASRRITRTHPARRPPPGPRVRTCSFCWHPVTASLATAPAPFIPNSSPIRRGTAASFIVRAGRRCRTLTKIPHRGHGRKVMPVCGRRKGRARRGAADPVARAARRPRSVRPWRGVDSAPSWGTATVRGTSPATPARQDTVGVSFSRQGGRRVAAVRRAGGGVAGVRRRSPATPPRTCSGPPALTRFPGPANRGSALLVERD
jgi:hypothetical protein